MNTFLFPNTYDKDNWISAGETMVIGRLGELEIQRPYGRDVVTVVASEKQFTDPEETSKIPRAATTQSLLQIPTGPFGCEEEG